MAEALEGGNILAVQWHPENLADSAVPEARALFRWLVSGTSRPAAESDKGSH